MNRSELERRVAERTGLASTTAKGAVDAVFEVIAEALASGEDARLTRFGVFGTRERPARTGRNPRRGRACRSRPRRRLRSRRRRR